MRAEYSGLRPGMVDLFDDAGTCLGPITVESALDLADGLREAAGIANGETFTPRLCPFCGGETAIVSVLGICYRVRCARCHARGPSSRIWREAVGRWNRVCADRRETE